MESTSNTLGSISLGQERPEFLVIDLSQSLPRVCQTLNLLPPNSHYPDHEALFKMVFDSVASKLNPAPQVLKAKIEDIYKDIDSVMRETIFVNLLVMGLQIVDELNRLNLWSEAGYAMYAFDHFLNENTVVLGRVRTFSY